MSVHVSLDVGHPGRDKDVVLKKAKLIHNQHFEIWLGVVYRAIKDTTKLIKVRG